MAGAADAHGYVTVERVRQAAPERLYIAHRQTRVQRAHAAGDVKADAAGRNDPALIGVECSHTADGKAITPVGVRHHETRRDDARQLSHVDRLLVDFLVHAPNQLAVAVDDSGNAHAPAGVYAPNVVRDLRQSIQIHRVNS